MKIKAIHIKSYQGFRDFSLDIKADDDSASIVVLAGINGSGKTTLLRYIDEAATDSAKSASMVVTPEDEKISLENIIYFPAETPISESADYITASILKYVDRVVYEEGRRSFEAYSHIREILNVLFKELSLAIEFKTVTAEKNCCL